MKDTWRAICVLRGLRERPTAHCRYILLGARGAACRMHACMDLHATMNHRHLAGSVRQLRFLRTSLNHTLNLTRVNSRLQDVAVLSRSRSARTPFPPFPKTHVTYKPTTPEFARTASAVYPRNGETCPKMPEKYHLMQMLRRSMQTPIANASEIICACPRALV